MVTRPFPINPILTAVCIGYRNRSMIADQVLPRIPVMGEVYRFTRYPIAEMFTVPKTLVGRRGRVERVEFTGTQDQGSTRDYALEDAIPISDINAAAAQRTAGLGNFDPEARAAEGLANLLELDREVRVAAIVQDPNNYAASRRLVLSGSDQFSDPASKPIPVLKAAFGATLIYRPNTITMGRDAWSGLSSNPQLVNAVKGNVTSSGIITPDEFVNLFAGEGLKRILIGESFVNTARPGQAANLSRVWGKSIALHYQDDQIRPEQGGVTWGFSAQYGTRGSANWQDRDVGAEGGNVVRVWEKIDEKVVAPDAGFLLQNAVA